MVRSAPVQGVTRRAVSRGLLPRRAYGRVLPMGAYSVATPGGHVVTYLADERDVIARQIVWPSGWEATSLQLFSQLSTGARGVLDVGAFTGIYTLVAAADSQAEVIAFEPNTGILPNLRRNVEANDLGHRVRIVAAAVSDSSGTARLSVPTKDPTCAALVEDGLPGVEVPRVTLDDAVGDLPVDLVKLDVEGAEEAALRGARGLISEHLPDLIVELLTADAFRAVSGLLRTWGYTEVRHLGSAGPVPVERHVQEAKHYNFHFVSPRRGSAGTASR